MRFKSIHIVEGIFSKTFDFSNERNLIYSEKNCAGKTTLVRLLLFSIGYPIPGTKMMDFDKIVTDVICEKDNGDLIEIKRYRNELTELYNGQQNTYMLPSEHNRFLELLFGIKNADILNNLLGTFYIDQEKGWTLLNDGKVIGNISFNIEELIRGLTDKDCTELLKRQSSVNYQISRYKKMLSLSKYQQQIATIKGSLSTDTYNTKINDQLAALAFEKQQLQEELQGIKHILENQENFRKHVEQMHLVVAKDGVEIPVNSNTIKSFNDFRNITKARINNLLLEIKKVTNKINDLEAQLDKENNINLGVKSMADKFDERITTMDLDYALISKQLEHLREEKRNLQELITRATTLDNESFIKEIYEQIYAYMGQLGVANFAPKKSNYLFTNDLKSLSGAVLQLTTLSFKLGYVTTIKRVTGIKVPIILDSPRGHELDELNVQKIAKLLIDEFSDHQIIIASIYKDFDASKLIPLEKSLLGMDLKPIE